MFTCKIEAGFRVFIFIILHFVLTNCIREDMSGCPRDDGGLALKFSYDTNADSRLSTAQGVDRLAVFIFDEKGLFYLSGKRFYDFNQRRLCHGAALQTGQLPIL